MEKSYVLELQRSLFEDLYLCYAGYAQCEPNHVFGPASRPNYIIHYVIEGEGIYEVDGRRHVIKAHQGFLIEPDELTYYKANPDNPWTYFWVGFSGTRAQDFLADAGLDHEHLVFSNRKEDHLEKVVIDMLHEKGLSLASKYRLQALLLDFFSCLMDSTIEMPLGGSAHEYVREAVKYIQSRFGQPIQVSDIANYLGVDRSYLYKIFRKELKMSVQEYLSVFRISNAKELLAVSDYSIEQIASACGYTDTRTFSKLFKRATGLTCSAYRKQHSRTVGRIRQDFSEILLRDFENQAQSSALQKAPASFSEKAEETDHLKATDGSAADSYGNLSDQNS